MSEAQFPVPQPVESFWTASPDALDNFRSSSKLPPQCDVLIIGSGYAGTSTAYHLMQSGFDMSSVLLLEARQICSGATGRNGGHVKPDTYFNVPKYSQLFGAKAAAEIVQFETSQVLAVKELVEREKLDCDFQLTRGVDVYLDAAFARRTADSYRKLAEEGAIAMRDVAYTDSDNAERISGVHGAKGCFTFTAASLWPKKMIQQLLGRLIEAGLQVQSHTPVTKVSSSQDSQGRWTVETPRGTIKAGKVVYCTNAYTSALLPRYKYKIVPVRGICSRIVTPKGKDSPHLPNTYSLRFDDQQYDYLISRSDGSIIVGGARKAFWHIKDSWFGNICDAELVKGGDEYFDGYMQKYFRGWESSDAKLDTIWTGIMGYSSDFVPHLGQVPNKSGQFIIAAFSGHGMPQILLAARGIAKMVTDGVPYEQTGLPSVFKSTNERLDTERNALEESYKNLWEPEPKARL